MAPDLRKAAGLQSKKGSCPFGTNYGTVSGTNIIT